MLMQFPGMLSPAARAHHSSGELIFIPWYLIILGIIFICLLTYFSIEGFGPIKKLTRKRSKNIDCNRTRYYKLWLIPAVWLVKKLGKQITYDTMIDPFNRSNTKYTFHRIDNKTAICFLKEKDEN